MHRKSVICSSKDSLEVYFVIQVRQKEKMVKLVFIYGSSTAIKSIEETYRGWSSRVEFRILGYEAGRIQVQTCRGISTSVRAFNNILI